MTAVSPTTTTDLYHTYSTDRRHADSGVNSPDNFELVSTGRENIILQAGIVADDSQSGETEVSLEKYDAIIDRYAAKVGSDYTDKSSRSGDVYFGVLDKLDYEMAVSLRDEVHHYISENTWDDAVTGNERLALSTLQYLIDYSDFDHSDSTFQTRRILLESSLRRMYKDKLVVVLPDPAGEESYDKRQTERQLQFNQLVELFEPYHDAVIDVTQFDAFWQNLKSEMRMGVFTDYGDEATSEMVRDIDGSLRLDLGRIYPSLDLETIESLEHLKNLLILQIEMEQNPETERHLKQCVESYFDAVTRSYNFNDPIQYRWHSRYNPYPSNGKPLVEFSDVFSIKTLYTLSEKNSQYESEDINRSLVGLETTLSCAASFLAASMGDTSLDDSSFEDLVLNIGDGAAVKIVLSSFQELGEMALALYDRYLYYQEEFSREEVIRRLDYIQRRFHQRQFEIPAETALHSFVLLRPITYRENKYVDIFDYSAPKPQDLAVTREDKRAAGENLTEIRAALVLLTDNPVVPASEKSKEYVQGLKRQLVLAILFADDLTATDQDLIDSPTDMAGFTQLIVDEFKQMESTVSLSNFASRLTPYLFADKDSSQVFLMPGIMDNSAANTWLDLIFWTNHSQINQALYFVLLVRSVAKNLMLQKGDAVSINDKKMLQELIDYFGQLVNGLIRKSYDMHG